MSETQEQVDQTQPEEVSPNQQLADALSKFDGAPDSNTIESWKQKFGEVFCSGFTDTELYIWRPVTRREYLDFQKNQNQESDFQEEVVNKCVIWSSDPTCLERKAGSVATLAEQIMQNSNFMAPQMAAQLVIKL